MTLKNSYFGLAAAPGPLITGPLVALWLVIGGWLRGGLGGELVCVSSLMARAF
jgi:hypothetical protein